MLKTTYKHNKIERVRTRHLNYSEFGYIIRDRYTISGREPTYVKSKIFDAVRECVTEKQYQYMYAYFGEGKKLNEIADEYEVSISTVSRCISRGLDRCRRMIIL